MDSFSEERLQEVHPELARRIRNLADQLVVRSISIRVTQGFRSYSDQLKLYAQGRTEPGPKVTDAPPGHSAHNFGYAVDIVPMDGTLPNWNAETPEWKSVLELALSCGLAEGAQWRTFPDRPHLYLQELPADPDDSMRSLFEAAGLAAVFEEIDKTYLGTPQA